MRVPDIMYSQKPILKKLRLESKNLWYFREHKSRERERKRDRELERVLLNWIKGKAFNGNKSTSYIWFTSTHWLSKGFSGNAPKQDLGLEVNLALNV